MIKIKQICDFQENVRQNYDNIPKQKHFALEKITGMWHEKFVC